MASSSSRPPRRGKAEDSDPATSDEPVYSFVRKSVFDRLKSSKKVTEEDMSALTALEEADDDEMLVPVDIRERLMKSADAMKAEMKEPRLQVEAYVRAEQLFATDSNPKQGRPVAMTAKAWKEQNLEDDSDFGEMEDLDLDDENFEMAEEEDLEYDEEIDLEDASSSGPASKKARLY
mmetsp:Transcript_22074/g.39584  ORF Transcript_22074/g.39584 Transcript_22074/m.39584 type:complete len:177 (+) Transcript_22074:51-581(+)